MELTGKIVDMSIDYGSGKPRITLEINEKIAASDKFEKLRKFDKLVVKISKYRKKRSTDANSYFWVLCTQLAEALSDEKTIYTSEDIYRQTIRESGIYRDFPNLSKDQARTLQTAWKQQGLGWFSEQVDYAQNGENVFIRCYYGSSIYNEKQMSRLIDNIIQDCQSVGIETKPPDEIARLKSLWGEDYEKYNAN